MRMEHGVFTPLSLKALLQEMVSLEHMLAAMPMTEYSTKAKVLEGTYR